MKKKEQTDERGNLLKKNVRERERECRWINIQRGCVCNEYFFVWFYTTLCSSFKTNRRTF